MTDFCNANAKQLGNDILYRHCGYA